MAKLDIALGGEWLLPFAKNLLREIKAQAARLGVQSMHRIMNIDSGERVHVRTHYGTDFISIVATTALGWATWFSGDLRVTGVLSERFTKLWAIGETASQFFFDTPPGYDSIRASFQNNSDVYGVGIGVDGNSVWVGLLSKYRRGGSFILQTSAGLSGFVPAGGARSLLLRTVPPASLSAQFRFHLITFDPIEKADGTVDLRASAKLVLDLALHPEAGPWEISSFFVDRDLRYAVWGANVATLANPSRAAISLDTSAGTATVYNVDGVNYSDPVNNGPGVPGLEFPAFASTLSVLGVMASGDNRPWSALQHIRAVTIVNTQVDTQNLSYMWGTAALFRGGVLVKSYGSQNSPFMYTFDLSNARAVSRSTGAMGFKYRRTPLVPFSLFPPPSDPTPAALNGVPYYLPNFAADVLTIGIAEGVSVTFEFVVPGVPAAYTLVMDEAATSMLVLPTLGGELKAWVVEKSPFGAWSASQVVNDGMSLLQTPGNQDLMSFVGGYPNKSIFTWLSRDLHGAYFSSSASKVGTTWSISHRFLGSIIQNTFGRPFDAPPVLAF